MRAHAARRPARPPPRRHGRTTTWARAHAARRPARPRAASHAHNHAALLAPGNGNDITHLQDHIVVDSKTDASQGSHDDVHCLQACAQARLPHSGSSGQLWDGSAARGCPRQQGEIRQGNRVRACIRCGCGCRRCAHATIVQQLKCTLAKRHHSRPGKEQSTQQRHRRTTRASWSREGPHRRCRSRRCRTRRCRCCRSRRCRSRRCRSRRRRRRTNSQRGGVGKGRTRAVVARLLLSESDRVELVLEYEKITS
jgi:hypothetical protein